MNEHLRDLREQAMYCVIHGGLDRKLRKKSIDYLTSLPFDGYAIGGSLGKNSDELMELLEWMMPLMNENAEGGNVDRRSKPRHLLGIADEKSILGAVKQGIDTMDSCYPTRLARHGTLLSREGKIHIRSGRYSRQYGVPIDRECSCSTCQNYDRPYLWHLIKAKVRSYVMFVNGLSLLLTKFALDLIICQTLCTQEPVFMTLAAIHNIQYMNDLMAEQRQLILEDKI